MSLTKSFVFSSIMRDANIYIVHGEGAREIFEDINVPEGEYPQ
jgi:hypothetical protein